MDGKNSHDSLAGLKVYYAYRLLEDGKNASQMTFLLPSDIQK